MTNRLTWAINDRLANDWKLECQALRRARTSLEADHADELVELRSAHELQEWVTEKVVGKFEQGSRRARFVTDSFQQVDWREIARAWLDRPDDEPSDNDP
jgi:hypothetical protein